MKLADFSGGLNVRIAPHLLSPIEAQQFTNIDHASGILKPNKKPLDMNLPIGKWFTYYYSNDEVVSSNTPVSWVEYLDILYSSEDDGVYKYDGNNKYTLGILPPAYDATITEDAPGLLNGKYKYVYTYYNSNDDTESQPSGISYELEVIDRKISVYGIKKSDNPQVDTIRLYRIGGTLANFSLLKELPNNDQTYQDNIPDTDLAGNEVLESVMFRQASVGLKYLTLGYAMLFGAVGNNLYFSDIGYPNNWPATNYIPFDAEITGIGVTQSGILVFTEYNTFIVLGNHPDNFTKYLLSQDQGCVNHYSIKFVDNTVLWQSHDGICASTGNQVKVITQDKLGKYDLISKNAEVLDSVYYLLREDCIMAYDFRYNQVIKKLLIEGDSLKAFNDELYISRNGSLHKMFAGDNESMIYKSPILTEGEYTNRKVYKDFYIHIKSPISVSIDIDGKNVFKKDLTTDGVHNLKSLGTKEGYGLTFFISGTGIVNEISYNVQGREKK